jgi:acid stress-induced BolA-like protein IbaG/YrbA
MITKVIIREDGSADFFLTGDGRRVDGTLVISCADGKEALKIQQTLYDALREFFPTKPVPISAMG